MVGRFNKGTKVSFCAEPHLQFPLQCKDPNLLQQTTGLAQIHFSVFVFLLVLFTSSNKKKFPFVK